MGLREQMYEVLSFHEYKSPLELRDELEELRTKQNCFFKQPSLGGIYVNFESMEKLGEVSSRYRTLSEDRLRRRGGKIELEFKLTQSGLRRRIESDKKDESLEGSLVPVRYSINYL